MVAPPGEEALVVTLWQDGGGESGTGGVVPTSTLDLPGGTGQAPSVAISPDGRWLAYTGISQLVDAAPAVYVVPLDGDGEVPGSLDPDLGAAIEIHTVTVADELDAIDALIEWSGPVADDGDVSRLRVRGADRQGALVLERTADGFQVQQRETYDGAVGGAIDISSDFVATDDGPVFAAGATASGTRCSRAARASRRRGARHLGVVPRRVSLDARGRTALLVGGGTAVTLRFPAGDGRRRPTGSATTWSPVRCSVGSHQPPRDRTPSRRNRPDRVRWSSGTVSWSPTTRRCR